MTDIRFIDELQTIVMQRLANNADDSYTASLARSGIRRIAQKVGEEAVELSLAAVDGTSDEMLGEAADLVYHLLVLLNARDLRLGDVASVLEARHRNED